MTRVIDDHQISRVLSITAHPDDVDFGSAGTIACWTDLGIEVTYAIVTDGDSGGFDPDVPRAEIPAIRRAEQTAAAKCVGVDDVRYLGFPDGQLEPGFELRRALARVIRQVRPDRVITHTPERNYEHVPPSHPDHRAVGSAAMDAVYPDARNPFAYPELLRGEGLDAWTVREMWLHGGQQPNHAVDVTDSFDRKVAALLSHASQTAHMDDLAHVLRERLGITARAAGLGDARLAESFQVVPTG